MWQQRAELSDLDADALDALSALWLYQARTPRMMPSPMSMNSSPCATCNRSSGAGRRSGYEPEQREAMLRALTHIQNLWLTMTEVEVYMAPNAHTRRRPEKQAVQSRVFLITDLLGQIRPAGGSISKNLFSAPGKVFAYFLHGADRQTALLSARALATTLPAGLGAPPALFELAVAYRAHAGAYGQVYRVDTLLEPSGKQSTPAVRPGRRPGWRKPSTQSSPMAAWRRGNIRNSM